jgi:alkylation response protein AidB-like acyl-CoA dehydrogenase
MTDFSLTEEQQALRELAHDFAEKEIRPVAWEYDREGAWPQAIMEKAWERDRLSVTAPRSERTSARPLLVLRRGANVSVCEEERGGLGDSDNACASHSSQQVACTRRLLG